MYEQQIGPANFSNLAVGIGWLGIAENWAVLKNVKKTASHIWVPQPRSSVSPCDVTDVNGDASFRWEAGVRGVPDQGGEAGIYGGRAYLLLSSGRGGPLLFCYWGGGIGKNSI